MSNCNDCEGGRHRDCGECGECGPRQWWSNCGRHRRPCDCDDCCRRRDRGECGEGECGKRRSRDCCEEGGSRRRDCCEEGGSRKRHCEEGGSRKRHCEEGGSRKRHCEEGGSRRRDCEEGGSRRRRDCECNRRDCGECAPRRRRDCECGRRDCNDCSNRGRGCNDCGKRRDDCKCHEKKPCHEKKHGGNGGLLLLKWSGRITQTTEIVVAELPDGGTLVDVPPSTPPEVNNRYVFASARCAKSISVRTHENTLSVQPAQVNVLIDGVVAFGLPVPTTPDKTLTRAIAIPIAAGHDLAVQVMLPPGDEENSGVLALTVTIEFEDGIENCCPIVVK